jgi:hypothetical protein
LCRLCMFNSTFPFGQFLSSRNSGEREHGRIEIGGERINEK